MPVPSPYRDQLEKLARREYRRQISSVGTHVTEYGPADAEPIVLVHGFRGDHHGLEPIAAHLPGYRSIIPDLPGFGDSEALDEGNVASYSRWLRDFTDSVAPGAAVLGHSFGSIVVAHAAARGLDARRIVLVNPIANEALKGGSKIASLVALGYYRAAAALPERVGLGLLGAPAIVRGMSVMMAKTKDSALRRWIHDQHARYFSDYASRDAVLEAFETSIRHTVSEVAGNIRTPVQLIAADRDDITPLAQQHALRSVFPDARLAVLADVGHLVHYERPREAAAIIRRFLSEPSSATEEFGR